jgi:hypothetical protein
MVNFQHICGMRQYRSLGCDADQPTAGCKPRSRQPGVYIHLNFRNWASSHMDRPRSRSTSSIRIMPLQCLDRNGQCSFHGWIRIGDRVESMGQRNDYLFHSVAADSEVDYLDTIRASFVKWDMENSLTQQVNSAPRPSLSLRTSSVHRWNYCTFLGFFFALHLTELALDWCS